MSRQQRSAEPNGRPEGQGQAGIRRSTLGLRAQPAPPADRPAPAPALVLDALGKKCPIPIIMLADRIGEVRVGQTVEVLADDPAAKTDLPAWCTLKSHEYVRTTALAAGWSFLVRRSY